MLLTGKPFVFAVGADIDEFGEITPERARLGGEAGHELFGRIRDLPFITLAAINGAALGGGVEIALHCDYRTIASSVRHFACPEVFLGLIPGWGGTQLVPQLVGAEQAVKFIVENPLRQNRMLRAPQALEAGFADTLLEPVEFSTRSRCSSRRSRTEPENVDPQPISRTLPRSAGRRGRGSTASSTAPPAPYRALDLIEGAASWPLEEGYRAEEEALADLLPGPQAQASVYAFNLVERRAKRATGVPGVEPRRIRKVGVVGAGLMARQLALLVLHRLEVPVVLRDLSQEQVDEARSWIADDSATWSARAGSVRKALPRFARHGRHRVGGLRRLRSRARGRLRGAGRQEGGLRRARARRLARVRARDEHVVALGEGDGRRSGASRAGRRHALLQPGRGASGRARANAADGRCVTRDGWVVTKGLRKTGVLVRDAPAFVVNRILARQGAVVTDALDHGNSVDETDEAVLRLGMPMAPSVLLQLVGPKVANHVRHTLHDAWPDRFPLSATLESLAAGGEPVVVEHAPRTVDEIHEAVLEAMADEVRHILEEGVVAEAADVDTCLLGAGFPFWLGGITKHLDQTGVSQRVVGRPLADLAATCVDTSVRL